MGLPHTCMYKLVVNMHLLHLATCEYSDITTRPTHDGQQQMQQKLCHRLLNNVLLLPLRVGLIQFAI